MIHINDGTTDYECENTNKPKMTNYGGRSWEDRFIKLDGASVKINYDINGDYAYFEHPAKGLWYKTDLTDVLTALKNGKSFMTGNAKKKKVRVVESKSRQHGKRKIFRTYHRRSAEN